MRKPTGSAAKKAAGKMKPARNTLKTAKRLIAYMTSGNKLRFGIICGLIVISALAGVVSSLFLKSLIDDYITPLIASPVKDYTPLFNAIVIMGMIFVTGMVATYLQNRLMLILSHRTLRRVRDDMFEHMQTLPVKYFDTHTHGEVMSHYTNDADTLQQMMTQGLPNVLSSVITVVSVFISMVVLNIPLAAFVVLFTFLLMAVGGFIGGNSGKYFISQQKSLGKLNGYVEEMMEGQKVVKVFCHENKAKADFDEVNNALCENSTKANVYANIMMPIMANLGTLQYLLIAMVGGLLAIYGIGGLSLGIIAAFLQLSRSFTMPLTQIAQQFNSIVMALAGAERIFELMDEESEADEGYVTLVNAKFENGELKETPERTGIWAWKHPHRSDGTVTFTQVKGDVRFFDVDFGYTKDKNVLHGIDLYAEPGQKVAFVGSTGAGKTTITNLINRFYDIQDGKIRYDGININKIRKADLRRSLGVVLQDTHLFTGTILENIRYGKLDATDEQVFAAARLAHADGFINMMPQGYNRVLTGDGAELSQGQRQLLSIARAALADPPVLILDEATSSIDTRTEAIVQKGMDNLMKGRTVFVIAHRLSTVRNSDAIMLMNFGEIVERGSHEMLLEQRGRYYQLYTGAFTLE